MWRRVKHLFKTISISQKEGTDTDATTDEQNNGTTSQLSEHNGSLTNIAASDDLSIMSNDEQNGHPQLFRCSGSLDGSIVDDESSSVLSHTNSRSDRDSALDISSTSAPPKDTIDYTRYYLETIVKHTIVKNTFGCLHTIANADVSYLHLFNSTIGRKERSGEEVRGQYTPSCLISELRAILSRQYEDPKTGECRPVSVLVNTEEKLQILCLYLLWTNEAVYKVSASTIPETPNARIKSNLLVFQQQFRTNSAPRLSMLSRSGSHSDASSFSLSRSNSRDSDIGYEDELPLTSCSFIYYQGKSCHHSYVIDLRYLHHNDLIFPSDHEPFDKLLAPSADMNLKKLSRSPVASESKKKLRAKTPLDAFIRGNHRLIRTLVQSDPKHFNVTDGTDGEAIHITFRDPCNSSLYDVEDFTVERFCEYSIRQAQFLSRLFECEGGNKKLTHVKYVSIVLIQHDLTGINSGELAIGIPSISRPQKVLNSAALASLALEYESSEESLNDKLFGKPSRRNAPPPSPGLPPHPLKKRSTASNINNSGCASPDIPPVATIQRSASSRTAPVKPSRWSSRSVRSSSPTTSGYRTPSISSNSSCSGDSENEDDLINDESLGFFGFELKYKVSVSPRSLSLKSTMNNQM